MTEVFLKKPTNHKTLIGRPSLFAVMPIAKLIEGGGATIQYNILTGDWFIEGQMGSPVPYIQQSLKKAICLAKTINHYNKTKERKKFLNGNVKELELQN